MYRLLIFLLIITSLAFGQFEPWKTFDHSRGFLNDTDGDYGFPTAGLKFLMDPARNMEMTVQDGLVLGTELVTNGEFTDFTFDTFDSTKAYYIFDTYYDQVEGGIGYIGQDWSGGTPSVATDKSSNDVNDYTPNGNCSIAHEMLEGDTTIKMTVTGSPGEVAFTRNSNAVVGALYKISFYAKSDDVSIPFYFVDGGYGDYTLIANPSLSSSWQLYELYLIARVTTADKPMVFASGTVSVSDVINFKDITIYEYSSGNHIVDHANDNSSFVGTGVTAGNPTYKDGNSLDFDGVTNHLFIDDTYATDFDPGTDDFSVELWIKHDSNATGSHVFAAKGEALGTGTQNGWEIFTTSSSVLFRCGTGSGTFDDASAYVVNGLRDDDWTHVVGVREDDTTWIYVDAVRNAVYGFGYAGVDISDPTQPLCIMARGDHGFEADGQVALFAYHKQALTAQQVAEQYGRGKSWLNSQAEADGSDFGNEDFSWRHRVAEPVGTSYGHIYQSVTGAVSAGTLFRAETSVKTSASQNWAWYLGGYWMRLASAFTNTDYTKMVYYGISNGVHRTTETRWYDQNYYAVHEYIRVQQVNNTIPTSISSDSTTADYIGTNTGTMQNGMYSDQPGHPSAFIFDGTADVIDLSEKIVIGTSDAIFFFWVQSFDWDNGGSGYRDIIGNYQNSAYAWIIRHGSDELYWWSEYGSGQIKSIFTNTAGCVDRQWYFVAIVHDRSESDGSKIFIDNVEQPLLADTQLPANHDIGDANWSNLPTIGQDYPGDGYYDGWLGMLGVYVFDGQDGRPSELPSNYTQILQQIYSWGQANRYGYTTDR